MAECCQVGVRGKLEEELSRLDGIGFAGIHRQSIDFGSVAINNAHN
jgi:hypothetical protein